MKRLIHELEVVLLPKVHLTAYSALESICGLGCSTLQRAQARSTLGCSNLQRARARSSLAIMKGLKYWFLCQSISSLFVF